MIRLLLPDDTVPSRRAARYRGTSLFLAAASVIIVFAHGIDILQANGPNWPALAIRLLWAGSLVVEAILLRRPSRRRLVWGATVAIFGSAGLYLALIAVTGGATSPVVPFAFVLVMILPLISYDLFALGLAGGFILLAGVVWMLVAGHASPDSLLALLNTGGAALLAGALFGRGLYLAGLAEEARHVALEEALDTNEHLVADLREALATNERLVADLREALASTRTLRGLLPVCAWCRRVRTDTGYWQQIEAYVAANSDAQITHGVCPDCAAREFADLEQVTDRPLQG